MSWQVSAGAVAQGGLDAMKATFSRYRTRGEDDQDLPEAAAG